MTADIEPAAGISLPVDLTTCDREPIHVIGTVQPFGFLIAVSRDWFVVHASQNVVTFVGCEVSAMLGRQLSDFISPEAIHVIRGRLQTLRGGDAAERAYGIPIHAGGPPFDIAVHLSGSNIVVEFEPSHLEDLNSASVVRGMIARLQQVGGFVPFCREAARQMRALTGFDRVMVYRFAHDGSGEVVAEAAQGGLGSYLGLRYPASDIPKQARALYERNWLRIIADVEAPPSPVTPALSPEGVPLDLSMSVLRAVSPIHIEYLKNMSVGASLSVSILRDGKLWGLFACHHMHPRHISLERRTAAELYGQMFSWILESRERAAEVAYEVRARTIHDRLLTAIAALGPGASALTDFLDEIAGIIPCDGVATCIDGEIALHGFTPDADEMQDLVRFLNRSTPGRVFATNEIGKLHAPGAAFAERAAGLLSIPISRAGRDYLIFFRREIAQSVTWAGDPSKSATPGNDGLRLTPRKSFEAWREVVRGQSAPWSEADLRIAGSLRITLLEVVLRVSDAAARERKAAQERQDLLIAELNHRVRNILNLISGLVSQSRAGVASVEDFVRVLGGRIQALARAHDQITTKQWGPGGLHELLAAETTAVLGPRAGRLRTDGPEVLLEPQAFTTLVLVFHELLTNATKYGSLSVAEGEVGVRWALEDNGNLRIDWREKGGPRVGTPPRQGFGATVIARSIPYELKGEARIAFEPSGLEATFVIPADLVHSAGSGPWASEAVATPASAAEPAPLAGTVLLVEDNMIIALEAEDVLRGLGAERVEMAGSVKDALRIIEEHAPAFALLDVNLGTETSFPIAERLQAAGTPFVFATGYGDNLRVPETLGAVRIVTKPYSADTIRVALSPKDGAGI